MTSLKYTKTHEWVRHSEGEESVTVGITEHAQHQLGDMVFVELPQEGDAFKAGDPIGVVESVKAASDIYAPISGVITAVNQTVCDNPALVNQAPLDGGWLVKMRPDQLAELASLLTTELIDSV